MRWFAAVVLVLACACSSDSDDGGAGPSSTERESTSTTVAVAVAVGPSLEELREQAFGTAACLTDPGCEVIEDVAVSGGELVISTALVDDSDADVPAQAICVVGTQQYEGRVVVEDSQGGELASGEAGAVPLCG